MELLGAFRDVAVTALTALMMGMARLDWQRHPLVIASHPAVGLRTSFVHIFLVISHETQSESLILYQLVATLRVSYPILLL